MKKEHHIVFIPGLNDQNPINKKLISLLPSLWRPYGLSVHIVFPHWEQGHFKPKLQRMLQVVDALIAHGYNVSVIGQSAGGSAAGNAFVERKNVLRGFVDITGRLRKGVNVHPSLSWAAKNSPAFAESVVLFENQNESKISKNDKKKILTIRPFFDEIVPGSTVPIEGATNLISAFPEHVIGGICIDIFYAQTIAKFLCNLR